jgi:hypothetical protein
MIGLVDLYTIVLAEDVAVDARRYGDLVAPMLGVTKIEAKMMVRKARGIFLEDLAEPDAARVMEELGRDGHKAWCVRNEELPALPPPRRVNWAQRSAGALRFRWAGDDLTVDLGWSQVGVASVAAIAQPEWRDLWNDIRFDHLPPLHALGSDPAARDLVRENVILRMSSDRARPAAPKKEGPSVFETLSTQYAGKLKVFCDIVDAGRSIWLRLPMEELGYALDEGGARFGDPWGMEYAVKDLRDRAPQAMTELALKFLSGADIKELVLLRVEEFQRYTAWHAIKKALRGAAMSSPSPAPPAPSTDGGSSSASPGAEPSSTSP